MNYSEKIAKRILEAILPGASLEYRQTQSHGEYDFDLHYGDGSKAAVEVTAAMDETLMKTLSTAKEQAARPFRQKSAKRVGLSSQPKDRLSGGSEQMPTSTLLNWRKKGLTGSFA
jgi:hypothetical protein